MKKENFLFLTWVYNKKEIAINIDNISNFYPYGEKETAIMMNHGIATSGGLIIVVSENYEKVKELFIPNLSGY